jgi:hypothetical protein
MQQKTARLRMIAISPRSRMSRWMMLLRQPGMKIVPARWRGEMLPGGREGTIVEASRNPQRQPQQTVLDSCPPPTVLYATNPCDQTVNRLHVQLHLDLNGPRVAYRQSRFQVLQAEETEVVAMMINMVGLTDLRSKDFLAKDLQVTEAARERRRGTPEILMGLKEVIVMTARGLGGLLLMPVILVKSLATPLAGSHWDHSKCLALKLRETILAHHTSGNLCLHSRCLALMVQERSLASRPSVNLFPRSRCLPRTILPTVTEAWAHPPRNLSHRSNMTPELLPTNKPRVLLLNL